MNYVLESVAMQAQAFYIARHRQTGVQLSANDEAEFRK